MVTRHITQKFDDINGEVIEDEGATISFSFDGKQYEIDLAAANAEAFRKALTPYIEAGRRVSSGSSSSSGRRRSASKDRSDLQAVREWAAREGYTIATRGRVPAQILDAYKAAHA